MRLKGAWRSAYYKATIVYVAVLVTTILGMQIYRFFYSVPASKLTCDRSVSALTLIPIVGVFFDA